MFRLLPLLVCAVGVASARRGGLHGNEPPRRPIITPDQQQRICADLCHSGLGGEPCGPVCFDLMPTGIPLQSPNDTGEVRKDPTRRDACPVLCQNRLGYPLCQCPTDTTNTASDFDSNSEKNTPEEDLQSGGNRRFRVDFQQICDHYCQSQEWALRGCPVCSKAALRQNGVLFKQDGGPLLKMANIPGSTSMAASGRKIDWDQWCHEQCVQGNGGSACNCDILPFSL